MNSLYDSERIIDCFTNSPRWKDYTDEIIRMHMSYKGHAVMMGYVVKEVLDSLADNYGTVTVLDVGCGTGMFLTYMNEARSLHRIAKYSGYDLVEDFANKAQAKVDEYGVNGFVYCLDFFKEGCPPESEVVIATQCLNTVFTDDKYMFIEKAIEKLWEATLYKLIFDLKDINAPKLYNDRVYYDPVKIYEICRRFSSNIKIEQTTKANFTVVMSRKELF